MKASHSNMKLKDQRRLISPGKYEYLLIVKNEECEVVEEVWLNLSNLSKRGEAKVTRKAISLRLCNMFGERSSAEFKLVMDCISKPAMTKGSRGTSDIDTSLFDSLMRKASA